MTEEIIHMKAIVVTDQAAGTAGMTLTERPDPQPAINDVVVRGRLRTNIGHVSSLDEALSALNPTERRNGKTIIRVRP
jgi:hypothetical protein